jgi:ATP-dependent exoDNAse (exonuclease V) beta subunit
MPGGRRSSGGSRGELGDDRGDRQRAEGGLATSYIVEAAAGTGKTTLLVGRILNLIKDRNALPDEIVAITFTERAAAELKIKLQDRLAQALAAASPDGDGHLADALRGLERMQVTTIHSFCAALIRERPVEAGIDPNFDVADELSASLIRDDIWEEWLSEHMHRDDPAIRRGLALGITTSNMQDLAYSMLANRDVLDYLPQPIAPTITIEEFITTLEGTRDCLKQMVKQSCKDPSDTVATLVEGLDTALGELRFLESADDKAAHLFTSLKVPSAKRVGAKAKWDSADRLAAARDEIDGIGQAYMDFRQWLAHTTITHLAERLGGFVERYKGAMAASAKLDFHDLLAYARDMLKNRREVRSYFRRRYRYMLVDEFQDTDPLQAEIIFFLSESDGPPAGTWDKVKVAPGKLFLVGDPKQSIYRFRRADIEMYASAKAGLGDKSSLSIFQNFRCAPSIVDAVNTVFADLIRPPADGAYQPAYVALKTGRDQSTLPPRHGLLLMYPPESLRDSMPKVGQRRTLEARAIAAFISKLVNDHKWTVWDKVHQRLRQVRPKDIAVLLRAHTALNDLEEAFKLYGVDYRVIGGKFFFMRQEVQQLLAVLLAIDNPYDKIALVAALRSPFFGISDEAMFLFRTERGDLNYLEDASGTTLEQAFLLLRDLHLCRNDLPPEILLRRLYEETKAPVVFLLRPGGEQRVHNLLKVGDIARALADRGMRTFRSFVHWLKERREEEAEEAEAATVETRDDFVRILTVHKAKGLEFPVVVLADLAGGRTRREPFIVDRRSGRIAIRTGRRDQGIQTADYDSAMDYESKRLDAEEKRLLYVAMTRARDFLVIPAYWATPREIDKNSGRPKEGSLLWYLADKIPGPEDLGAVPLMDGVSLYDVSNLDLEPEEPPALRLAAVEKSPGRKTVESIAREATEWRNTRQELKQLASRGRSLRTATEAVLASQAQGATVRPPAETAKGVRFGTLVHRLFEVTDWDNPEDLMHLAAAEIVALDLSEAEAQDAVEIVHRALKSPLISRVLSSDGYYKEVPFTYKQDGTLVEGKIDVVFREHGSVYVIDFKTDRIARKDLKARAEHYRGQAETYGGAIQAALGVQPEQIIFYFVAVDESVTFTP